MRSISVHYLTHGEASLGQMAKDYGLVQLQAHTMYRFSNAENSSSTSRGMHSTKCGFPFETNLRLKSCNISFPHNFLPVSQLLYHFSQNPEAIMPCHVYTLKTIEQLKWMLWKMGVRTLAKYICISQVYLTTATVLFCNYQTCWDSPQLACYWLKSPVVSSFVPLLFE